MKKWFRSTSLVYKITCMITCLLIIPTAVICMFYFKSYKDSLKNKAEISLKEEAAEIDNTVNSNLSLIENVLNEIDYSQELIYFLDNENSLSKREQTLFFDSIQEEWINIQYTYPNMFSLLTVYSSNKQLAADHNWKFRLESLETLRESEDFGSLNGHSTGHEDSFTDGAIVFGEIRKAKSNLSDHGSDLKIVDTQNYILPVYLTVKNIRTDELIGVIELDMPIDKLIDSRSIKNQGNDNQFILADDRNRILFRTGESPSSDSDILSASCRFAHVRMNGMVFIEESIAVKPAFDMIFRVGVVALSGIICIMVLTYLVIKKTLNRLIVMDDMMGRIETGDFHVLIEDDGYGDEVSRIKKRFNQMTLKLETVIAQMIEKENAQKDAELRALQAQINPHFLFNTLETMHMQCEIDRYYKIGNSLSALGEIFRYTMNWSGHEVPFSMEWNNLKNYIAIMALRLDDDFSYDLDCDESAMEIVVPKMLLQPIVENSFQHGFKGVPAPWYLHVAAAAENGCLLIRIEDNGSGIEPERLADIQKRMRERRPLNENEKRKSIGVINVLQRMDMVCGKGSAIEIENREEGGVCITITIVTEEEYVSNISS